MNEKINQLDERILDIFAEDESGLTKAHYDELSAYIENTEALAEILPVLKKRYNEYKEKTEQCDKTAKDYAESKNMWKSRSEQIAAFLGHVLERFRLKSYSANDTKVSITTREILETDTDALIAPQAARPEYMALEAALPPYIKITLSVDKTALKSYIKTNSKLLTDHPEWVHTKESKSVSVK